MEKEEHTDDLELRDLDQFYGTEQYWNVLGTKVTDGVKYVMDNGYSWFITDALAVIKTDPKLKKEEFLSIDLRLKPDSKAEMVITDGNDHELYKQQYKFTTAKRDLKLYYTDDVLLLSGEY